MENTSDSSAPRVGLSRCPFCKELLEFERAKWIACAGCLTRHHDSCWEEGRGCATCGDPRALALATAPKPRRSFGKAAVAAGTVLVASQVGMALYFTARIDQQRSVIERQAARLDEQAARIEKEAEATRKHADASIQNLAELVETKSTQIKNVVTGFRPPDFLEGLNERLEKMEAVHQKNEDQLRRIVDKVDREIASIPQKITIINETPDKSSKAAALEALNEARKDRFLYESEFGTAKDALIAGKLSPATAHELAALGKLSKDRTLSSSDLEKMKKELLEK